MFIWIGFLAYHAGISPGILLMLLFMLAIYLVTSRRPGLGPPGPKFGWKDKLKALGGGLFEALDMFTISMGGLFAGCGQGALV